MGPTLALQTTDWKRIEAEALAQVRSELVWAESAPLEHGRVVAWAECRFGRTDGLSAVHRVGSCLFNDDARTLCGEIIPPPIRRIALSVNVVRSLGKCRYCEEAHTHQEAVA